jgi:Tfp pilus assembly protein PilF
MTNRPPPTRSSITAFALLGAIVLCAGCATNRNDPERALALQTRMPELRDDLFGPPQPVPAPAELTALTDAQRAHFLDFFRAGVNNRHPVHRRIHVYLDRHLSDMTFDNETRTASATIDARRGNCMSLALVTTALAEAAGVEIGWQLADAEPVYSSEGTVVYSANHIQVKLYEPALDTKGYSFTLARDYLLLDYFVDDMPEHGTALQRDQMLSLAYQNLGVEALADDDLERAFWLLREALKYDAANPDAYNALAVVHRRAGAPDSAEALYRFTLDEFGDRLIVLRNYRRLLLAAGRHDEAAALERRIVALPDPDPFPLLQLGDEALDQGRPTTALSYYRKARKVAPYLHEIELRIARVHARSGDRSRARKHLERARRKAWTDADQRRYAAKLEALEQGR